MTAALLAVYLATVLVVARALPEMPAAGQLLGTALVALGFAPLRVWLQRAITRRLFGDRDQPFAALVRLSRDVAGSSTAPEHVLAALAASTAAALRAPWVRVELIAADHMVVGGDTGTQPHDGDVVRRDLTHAGDRVGRLTVAARRYDAYTAADLRLLADLAVPIGAALHTVRLSLDLRASRERIVTSVEDERRRTGRDLHDSLGPRLAALGMTAETAAELIDTDPAAAKRLLSVLLEQTGVAKRLLSVLLEQTGVAVDEVRRLAHAQRPPALDALGLIGALRTHLALVSPVDARLALRGDLSGSLPAAVEIAAYRIVLEAVTNVTRHAQATHCLVTVTSEPEQVVVEVSDDGCGLAEGSSEGFGLLSMRERAEALGGQLHVSSRCGGPGTVVRATLPHSSSSEPPDRVAHRART